MVDDDDPKTAPAGNEPAGNEKAETPPVEPPEGDQPEGEQAETKAEPEEELDLGEDDDDEQDDDDDGEEPSPQGEKNRLQRYREQIGTIEGRERGTPQP